jgi:GAF domain-containing protein
MSVAADPVLQAVATAAVSATDADQAWIVAPRGEELRVIAAVGSRAGELIGSTVAGDEEGIGWVIASGQPISLAPSSEDSGSAGVTHVLGRRISALLCVPCTGEEETVGALAVLDKVGGNAFPMHEAEIVSLLADIAGVALAQGADTRPLPAPAELTAGLADLAREDPERYAAMSSVVSTLLARG